MPNNFLGLLQHLNEKHDLQGISEEQTNYSFLFI
jgi:hypothetical protein